MRLFQDASIKKKVSLISLLTTGIALLIASGVLILYELIAYRNSLINSLTVQAKMISNNSTAALTFSDRKVAEEILAALNAVPNIICATIYTKEGKVFANYQRPGVRGDFIAPEPQKDSHHFGMNHLSLFQPILLDGEMVGTIYIRSNLKELYFRLMGFLGILIVAMGVSFLIAFFSWSKLHVRITRPILNLAQMMQMISKDKNYSVRAVIYNRDEIGSLAQGFNEMLEQIQKRDTELEIHRQHLEDQVAKRTAELKKTNERLQQELIERKRAEKAFRESEERYHKFVENLPIGVTRTTPGPQGTFLIANQTYLRMFGFDSEEDLKKISAADLYADPNQRKGISDTLMTLGSITGLDLQLKKKDGTIWWGSFTGRAVTNGNGEDVFFDCTVEDITNRKQADQEKLALEEQLRRSQKMEAVGTLAGGIAHDFNNLLHAILGFSEILLMDKGKGKGKEDKEYLALQAIHRGAQRGAELTRQLLTFSQKVESKLRPVNLNHEVRQIEKLLQRTIPKMIEVELVLAKDLQMINADPVQVGQVLMNLAINARDAMPEGGRLVIETQNLIFDKEFCRAHVGTKPGDYVLLSISDTGVGIEKELLGRIFEPFFTTKGVGKGTGLGLAVVYGIVKNHEGYIESESEMGKGTTFRIYWPVIEGLYMQSEDVGTGGVIRGGPETILLVDDEESIRELGKEILSSFGYRVLSASNGEEAIEIYRNRSERFDLIILDLMMPGMGGRKCLEELLRINPDVKVLIATGYMLDEETKKILVTEAKGFITKPYVMRNILQVVREVLDR